MGELDQYGTDIFLARLAGTVFDLEAMRPVVSFGGSVGYIETAVGPLSNSLAIDGIRCMA